MAVNQSNFTAGIDVGGTKTFVCIADSQGTPVLKKKFPTLKGTDPDVFFGWLFTEMHGMLSKEGLQTEELSGIGMGFPGVILNETGILTNAPAFSWPATDIRPIIRKYYDGPVYLDNDVNMAARGEHWKGAAQGKRHVLMITIGTGIGSALIMNGDLYEGADGASGEIGNWVLEASYPSHISRKAGEEFGPFENVTSGTSIGVFARKYFCFGERVSSIMDMAGGRVDRIEPLHVLKAASEGDQSALWIMESPLNHMAMGIANAVSLLNPQLVVLGGGVAGSSSFYVNEVRRRASKLTPLPLHIEQAELGNEAGAFGAIAAVRAKMSSDLDSRGSHSR
ncbi:ROK family protein [Cohnella silvisoli]|uniref:ROK family protein n=1 Tax=Cohnella silvisoli TaxID=2873699 RepID=A0ABV1KUC3_9BACL|nr:ROK family protein [Cohnella silvisoli]MCD9023110.1 ROK family protein [Cohnella silvisoli]